jgi:hypothetical protein
MTLVSSAGGLKLHGSSGYHNGMLWNRVPYGRLSITSPARAGLSRSRRFGIEKMGKPTRERPPGFRATVSICAQEDGRLERRVSGTQRHGTASTENKAQTMPEISVADFWVDDLSRLAGSPNDRSQYTQNFHSRIHDPVFLAIYGV